MASSLTCTLGDLAVPTLRSGALGRGERRKEKGPVKDHDSSERLWLQGR